jgi:nucleoside-diphosphate-sugar epimerase
MLSDKNILITGVTGMVPMPVAAHLAQDNEVWRGSHFSDQCGATINGNDLTSNKSPCGAGQH